MSTSSTASMVLERGRSAGSSLLVLDLLCCSEPSSGLWLTNSEIFSKFNLMNLSGLVLY